MLRMDKKTEAKLAVFGFGGLQNLVTLFDLLEKENISIGDVRNYVVSTVRRTEEKEATFQRMRKKQEERWTKGTRRCPTCMRPLALRAINIPKGKANREGHTCHWFCIEETCNFEEYTKEDFREIYTKIMGG